MCNNAIKIHFILLIILVLCLMLSMTHYAQNYAGIIGGSLVISTSVKIHLGMMYFVICLEEKMIFMIGILTISIFDQNWDGMLVSRNIKELVKQHI